jgi:hypothetical protein
MWKLKKNQYREYIWGPFHYCVKGSHAGKVVFASIRSKFLTLYFTIYTYINHIRVWTPYGQVWPFTKKGVPGWQNQNLFKVPKIFITFLETGVTDLLEGRFKLFKNDKAAKRILEVERRQYLEKCKLSGITPKGAIHD